MRKLLFFVFALSSMTMLAQAKFGVKAGLNYNQNGDLTLSQVGNAAEDAVTGSDGKIGYHFGVFANLPLSKFYVRPELVYTKTKSEYDGADYDLSKLDLPVLLGYKIIGPLSIFAGPDFQYILDNDLDDVNLNDVESDFTIGLHIGAALQLGNLGLDIRYERGLSDNEADFVSDNITNIQGRVDSRPSQIILGVSLNL